MILVVYISADLLELNVRKNHWKWCCFKYRILNTLKRNVYSYFAGLLGSFKNILSSFCDLFLYYLKAPTPCFRHGINDVSFIDLSFLTHLLLKLLSGYSVRWLVLFIVALFAFNLLIWDSI